MKSESASVGAGVCVWTGAVGSSAGGWTISTSRASSSARSSTRSSSSRSCSSANASRAASSIDSCSSASSRNAGTASSSVVLSSSSHPSLRRCRANGWAFATNHYNGLRGRCIPCGTKKIRRAGFAFVHFARLTFRFRVLPSGEASSYSRSVLGAREVEQHFVVVQRQPVLGDEFRVEAANARRVRPQERNPGLDLRCRPWRCLRTQNLTPQLSLLILLIAQILADEREEQA